MPAKLSAVGGANTPEVVMNRLLFKEFMRMTTTGYTHRMQTRVKTTVAMRLLLLFFSVIMPAPPSSMLL